MAIEQATRTWLEQIESNHFDPWTRDRMIEEVPHTYFAGLLPAILDFLQGKFVDLGFENLGLPQEQLRKIMLAFGGSGVCIPDTSYKMRFVYPHAAIEQSDGSEGATLPASWKEGVLVVDDQAIPTWIGKKVRPEQTAGFDLQGYKDAGEGLTPA